MYKTYILPIEDLAKIESILNEHTNIENYSINLSSSIILIVLKLKRAKQ